MSVPFEFALPPYADAPVPFVNVEATATTAPRARVTPIRFPHIPARDRAEAKPHQYVTATGTVLRRDEPHPTATTLELTPSPTTTTADRPAVGGEPAQDRGGRNPATDPKTPGKPPAQHSAVVSSVQVAQIAALLQGRIAANVRSAQLNREAISAVNHLRRRIIEHGHGLVHACADDAQVWESFVELCQAYTAVARSLEMS